MFSYDLVPWTLPNTSKSTDIIFLVAMLTCKADRNSPYEVDSSNSSGPN